MARDEDCPVGERDGLSKLEARAINRGGVTNDQAVAACRHSLKLQPINKECARLKEERAYHRAMKRQIKEVEDTIRDLRESLKEESTKRLKAELINRKKRKDVAREWAENQEAARAKREALREERRKAKEEDEAERQRLKDEWGRLKRQGKLVSSRNTDRCA